MAAAAAALAACSGETPHSNPSESTATNADTVSGPGIDATRQGPAPEIEGAASGGIVTVFDFQWNDSPYGPRTVDPTEAYYWDAVSILSGLVTRSLTQYVYNAERDTMVVVPDIATDVGTPNDDFTEWTYTIRRGVKFEDGTEVTAEDVAYGILRSFDREAFPNGPTYSNDYFLDGESYQGPYHSGTSPDLYEGIDVEGDTLTLKMARPFPDLPYWTTWPAMGPIPQIGSLPAEYKLHPLATGPYRVDDYEPGKSLTLVQNDQWDPDTDPGRHQYVDEFRFDFQTPSGEIETTLLGDSGDAQTTIGIDPLQSSIVRTAESEAPDRLLSGPSPCTFMFAPDYRQIDEIKVRQALGYAYPYEELWRRRGDIEGLTMLPGTSILGPAVPGRLDFNPLSIEPGQTDPDKSKALLLEAGYQPGKYRIDMAYLEDDPYDVDVAAARAKALELGGFKVTLHPQPDSDAFDAVISDPASPVNVRPGGWCPDWPTGASWFPRLTSHNPGYNTAYFHEKAVEDEIERIGFLPLDEQPEAWGALDKEIMTKYYPTIVTGYPGVAMLHGSRLGGVNFDNVASMPTWKDMHVEQ